MYNHWNDIERTWAAMEALRRGMNQAFSGSESGETPRFGRLIQAAAARTPAVDIFEVEDAYLVTADLPGFKREDVELKFANDQLLISATRAAATPEGYQAVMEERGALQLSKALGFAAKIDAEHIEAKLSDGVLEVRIPKHPEAKPRQIPIHIG